MEMRKCRFGSLVRKMIEFVFAQLFKIVDDRFRGSKGEIDERGPVILRRNHDVWDGGIEYESTR